MRDSENCLASLHANTGIDMTDILLDAQYRRACGDPTVSDISRGVDMRTILYTTLQQLYNVCTHWLHIITVRLAVFLTSKGQHIIKAYITSCCTHLAMNLVPANASSQCSLTKVSCCKCAQLQLSCTEHVLHSRRLIAAATAQ